jgi:hypothetical protein
MLLQTLLGYALKSTVPESGRPTQILSHTVHEEDVGKGFEVINVDSFYGAPKFRQPRQTHFHTTQHLNFKEDVG